MCDLNQADYFVMDERGERAREALQWLQSYHVQGIITDEVCPLSFVEVIEVHILTRSATRVDSSTDTNTTGVQGAEANDFTRIQFETTLVHASARVSCSHERADRFVLDLVCTFVRCL